MNRSALIYGVVVAFAVFMIGWTTGMGGAFMPNLAFSLVMGVFSAWLYAFFQRRAGRKE